MRFKFRVLLKKKLSNPTVSCHACGFDELTYFYIQFWRHAFYFRSDWVIINNLLIIIYDSVYDS